MFKYYTYQDFTDELTTKTLRQSQEDGETVTMYGQKDGLNLIGVDTVDHAAFIARQEAEICLQEVPFAGIEQDLKDCHLYKELNRIIVDKIREKYSINDEFAAIKMDRDSGAYKAYAAYVEECKQWGKAEKIKYGLVPEESYAV